MNIYEYNRHIKLHIQKRDFEKLNKKLSKLWFTATVIESKEMPSVHIIIDRIDGLQHETFSHVYVIWSYQLYQYKKKNIKEFIKLLIPN